LIDNFLILSDSNSSEIVDTCLLKGAVTLHNIRR